MNIVRPVKTLNCKGYKCPLPQVQAKEALEQIDDMEVIEILTTDADAEIELQNWTQQTRDIYLSFEKKEDYAAHYIQKAPSEKRKNDNHFTKIISNQELKQNLLCNRDYVLVDVREEIEFFIGHIPEAINIPLGDLKDNIKKLDKEKTFYIICRTGNRSDFACQMLEKNGFLIVFNVLPGMSEWDGEISD